MTLIEALLLLPENGEPEVVARAAARVLTGASAKFVRRQGTLWSLTDAGQHFIAQFRQGKPDPVMYIVVRLVIEDDEPMFHLLCDETMLLKVDKTDLRRKLQELQSVNPGVKVVFDFRPSGHTL